MSRRLRFRSPPLGTCFRTLYVPSIKYLSLSTHFTFLSQNFPVGRKPIFQLTLVCYTLFHLGQALAPNLATLLVTRFFAGLFAVAPLSNCGGVMFDIWDPFMRGYATAIFLAGVFLGPVLGPIVGGLYVPPHYP